MISKGFLEDLQLLWGVLGVSLSGLGAAFLAGLWTGRLPIPGLKREIGRLQKLVRRLEEQVERLRQTLEGNQTISSEPADVAVVSLPTSIVTSDASIQVWLQKPLKEQDAADLATRPPMPILLVANLKGGVGKTMLTANLGCYFAARGSYPATNALRSMKTLAIDLDYQGSLTDMVLKAFAQPLQGGSSDVKTLFNLQRTSLPIRGEDRLSRLSLLGAEYLFDDFESRLQFDWLSGAEDDIRIRLLRKLRMEEFAEHEMILIDTGPRLATGSVAGLIAASHLLVPSALDTRSQQATERFLTRIGEFIRRGLCPKLKVIGVIPTLRSGFDDADAIESLRQRVGKVWSSYPELFSKNDEPVLPCELPRLPTIQAHAEDNIPYLVSRQTRVIFNGIGAEVERRMAHEGG